MSWFKTWIKPIQLIPALVSEPVGMLTLMPSQAFCRIQVWYVYRIHTRRCSYFKLAQKNFQVRGTNARTILQTKPAKPFGPISGRSLCTCTQTKQSKTSSTKDVILVLVRLICLQVHNKRLYDHQNMLAGHHFRNVEEPSSGRYDNQNIGNTIHILFGAHSWA